MSNKHESDGRSEEKKVDEKAEEIKKQANAVFQKLPLLGPVAWLYSQSQGHKNYFVSDLSWLVLPPLISNQYKLYLKNDAPIAYICWAKISDEVAQRIQKSNQLRISTDEWNCGENIWIIDVVAPFGGLDNTIKDVRDTVFPGKEIHMYLPAMPGQSEGKVMKFKTPEKEASEKNNSSENNSIH